MDMDQLRKINQLSSELKKHKMADSSMDAYSQAQHIVQVIPKGSISQPQETVMVEAAPADPLVARQFEIEMQRVQKGLSDELEVMRNAMNQIIAEVNALREDLSKAQAAQPPRPKEKQEALKTETKEPHPRQGDYKPGDIDIKSVFYFGNKK